MEDDYFGQAAADLEAASGRADETTRDYRVARAQVNALLAIAASLGEVVGEMRRIRHSMGDWSDD